MYLNIKLFIAIPKMTHIGYNAVLQIGLAMSGPFLDWQKLRASIGALNTFFWFVIRTKQSNLFYGILTPILFSEILSL